mmetsp:Transcript_32764/g.61149  ORF Transcript_32764/g.61149 Transcript_32764/m.61149 type:complete len:357 (+) Transcript_32764:39-1109(+)
MSGSTSVNATLGDQPQKESSAKPNQSIQDLWTIEEDEKLTEAVQIFTDPTKLKRKRIDWDAVSTYMNGTRSFKQCYSRWTTTAMHNLDGRKVGPWDPEDDAKLVVEVERQKRENNMKVSWEAVSKNVNLQRNRKQCMARYNNVLQFQTCATKKVGVWDAKEDTKLIEAVEMFRGKGRKNGISWGDVVKQLNNTRSQKQCKKRWDDAFADVYRNRVATTQAVSTQPVSTQPATAQPVTAQSVTAQPITEEPVKSVYSVPVVEKEASQPPIPPSYALGINPVFMQGTSTYNCTGRSDLKRFRTSEISGGGLAVMTSLPGIGGYPMKSPHLWSEQEDALVAGSLLNLSRMNPSNGPENA